MSTPADPLSALLRRADPAADATVHAPAGSAAFAAAVHARIQSADTTAADTPLRRAGLGGHLFPLAAALAIVASLAAGGSLAYAGAQRERVESHASAFARSIDPWLMHADRSAPSAPPARAHLHP